MNKILNIAIISINLHANTDVVGEKISSLGLHITIKVYNFRIAWLLIVMYMIQRCFFFLSRGVYVAGRCRARWCRLRLLIAWSPQAIVIHHVWHLFCLDVDYFLVIYLSRIAWLSIVSETTMWIEGEGGGPRTDNHLQSLEVILLLVTKGISIFQKINK